MDKLNTELYGGFPFELDDWRWEINAHREAIGAIVGGLGNSAPLVIAGIVGLPALGPLMPGLSAVTPGWVAWDDELWRFPGAAGNPMVPIDRHYLHRVVSLDPSGAKTFEDGSTQNPYERRRIELVADGVNRDNDPAYIRVADVNRLQRVLAPTDWTQVVPAPGFELPAGEEAGWRIEPGNVLRLGGAIRWTGAGYEDQAFKMPLEARPVMQLIRMPVARVPLGGYPDTVHFAALRSSPGWAGFQITDPQNPAPVAGDKFYLDGITYPVAG